MILSLRQKIIKVWSNLLMARNAGPEADLYDVFHYSYHYSEANLEK